jgi:hypothetical protein
MHLRTTRHQEITIMSLHIVKFLSPTLALISAALLIHVGGAVAADSAGDAQQQARELLAGRIATQSAPSERRAERAVRPTADVQELARRVLLGVTDSGVRGTKPITPPDNAVARVEFTVQKSVHARGDAQAMARRLLLGQANAAGS